MFDFLCLESFCLICFLMYFWVILFILWCGLVCVDEGLVGFNCEVFFCEMCIVCIGMFCLGWKNYFLSEYFLDYMVNMNSVVEM